jgi:heme exporter protein D
MATGMNWTAFFSMGGYAVYVWGSYFATVAAITAEILLVRRRKKLLQRVRACAGRGTNI